jgi:hypothetical protein
MVKNYGDLPLVKLNEIRHITISGSECLCGCKWKCGVRDRDGKVQNIIHRNLDAVTCERCKEIYLSNQGG